MIRILRNIERYCWAHKLIIPPLYVDLVDLFKPEQTIDPSVSSRNAFETFHERSGADNTI